MGYDTQQGCKTCALHSRNDTSYAYSEETRVLLNQPLPFFSLQREEIYRTLFTAFSYKLNSASSEIRHLRSLPYFAPQHLLRLNYYFVKSNEIIN